MTAESASILSLGTPMAFQIPAFNLSVNIWRFTNPPAVAGVRNPPTLTVLGNLQFALKAKVDTVFGSGSSLMYLLLPALTDIRAAWDAGLQDTFEAPAGSGRFYNVVFVDDVAKGFTNEYRIAAGIQVTQPLTAWGLAFPIPLP